MVREKRTTVRVPVWLRDDLKRVANAMNVPMWKVIHTAIEKKGLEFIEETIRKGVIAEKKLDKAMWYAFKLINSIAYLKKTVELYKDGLIEEEDVKAELNATMRTLAQIEERLGVDVENVREAIEKFLNNPNGKTTANLNDNVKLAVVRIIMTVTK